MFPTQKLLHVIILILRWISITHIQHETHKAKQQESLEPHHLIRSAPGPMKLLLSGITQERETAEEQTVMFWLWFQVFCWSPIKNLEHKAGAAVRETDHLIQSWLMSHSSVSLWLLPLGGASLTSLPSHNQTRERTEKNSYWWMQTHSHTHTQSVTNVLITSRSGQVWVSERVCVCVRAYLITSVTAHTPLILILIAILTRKQVYCKWRSVMSVCCEASVTLICSDVIHYELHFLTSETRNNNPHKWLYNNH